MPKFMTYQRPTPVNKAAWSGRPAANPYQPERKPGAAHACGFPGHRRRPVRAGEQT